MLVEGGQRHPSRVEDTWGPILADLAEFRAQARHCWGGGCGSTVEVGARGCGVLGACSAQDLTQSYVLTSQVLQPLGPTFIAPNWEVGSGSELSILPKRAIPNFSDFHSSHF